MQDAVCSLRCSLRCKKQSWLPSCVNAFSSCYDRVMAYSGTLEKTKGTKTYQVKIENFNFDIKDENIDIFLTGNAYFIF